jgi:hypothetical protein
VDPDVKLLNNGVVVMFFVALVAAAIGAVHLRHPMVFTPDGEIYARMMLADRGVDPQTAEALADAAVAASPDGAESLIAVKQPKPSWFVEQAPLFRGRVLYPYLASLLYPRFGFKSLAIVSAIAFVVATLALYALLLFFGRPWLAAIVALGTAGAAPLSDLAARPLTDSLAFAFWAIALLAVIALLRTDAGPWLLLLGVALIAMVVTRPALQLIVGLLLGGFAVTKWVAAVEIRKRAMLVSFVALGVLVLYAAWLVIGHEPSIVSHLVWIHSWQYAVGSAPAGFAAWYVRAAATTAAQEFLLAIYHGAPLLAVTLAAIGLASRRTDPLVPMLAGIALGDVIAIFANPVAVARGFEVPLLPIVAIGLLMLAENTIARGAQPAPAQA